MEKDITPIIKALFKLDESRNISELLSNEEAKSIQGFSGLLSKLIEGSYPKAIREALEAVIVSIKLKKEPTPKEKAFLEQIEAYLEESTSKLVDHEAAAGAGGPSF